MGRVGLGEEVKLSTQTPPVWGDCPLATHEMSGPNVTSAAAGAYAARPYAWKEPGRVKTLNQCAGPEGAEVPGERARTTMHIDRAVDARGSCQAGP